MHEQAQRTHFSALTLTPRAGGCAGGGNAAREACIEDSLFARAAARELADACMRCELILDFGVSVQSFGNFSVAALGSVGELNTLHKNRNGIISTPMRKQYRT